MFLPSMLMSLSAVKVQLARFCDGFLRKICSKLLSSKCFVMIKFYHFFSLLHLLRLSLLVLIGFRFRQVSLIEARLRSRNKERIAQTEI